MAVPGVFFMINGAGVVSPDTEVWDPISMGAALTGEQKRSHYRHLRWQKTIAEKCDLDWWEYDNVTLTSLTTRPPDELAMSETYSDAICQSVTMRHSHGRGIDVTANFLVNVENP